jgi:release factor glutamine methyltransferase
LTNRVRFLRSNLLESVQPGFDVIVANLPYVSTEDRRHLSHEVLHDPEIAVFAGARGHELLVKLIAQALSRLRPGGMLAMEIGIGQTETLVAALAEKNYRDIWRENDYSGVTRFLFARYG